MTKTKPLPKVRSACHHAPVIEVSAKVEVPKPVEGASYVAGEKKPTAQQIKDSKFKTPEGETVQFPLPEKLEFRKEVKHQKTAVQVQQVCVKCDEPTNAEPYPVDKDWDKEPEDEEAAEE